MNHGSVVGNHGLEGLPYALQIWKQSIVMFNTLMLGAPDDTPIDSLFLSQNELNSEDLFHSPSSPRVSPKDPYVRKFQRC